MKTVLIFALLLLAYCLSEAKDLNSDIFDASKRGDVLKVKNLLSKGVSANSKIEEGLTPLHAASAYGHVKVVTLLIENGADINASGDQSVTPLHSASLNGHLEVAEILINNGALVNAQDNRNGFSPLHWASWKGHLKLARLLIENGADVNLTMKQGQTPLMAAADNGQKGIIQYLISKKANLEARRNDGKTALLLMAFSGNKEMVRFLLSLGSDVNARDNKGSTPLIGAAYNGYEEIIEILLRNGADVNEKESDGQTALMCASYKGHIEIVKKLILNGAKIDLKKMDESDAVAAANAGGHDEISRFLLDRLSKESSKITFSRPKRYALIIGISEYQDTKIPTLRYAAKDAQLFYDWIVSEKGGQYPPSQVKLLLDKNATEKNLRNALFVWLAQAIEEDIVTIYFAGHGSPASPDSISNLFLLTYDTQYEDITSSSFPMWDIETAIKRFIKAKKAIVITDACHSGGIGESFNVARRTNRGIFINPISKSFEGLSKVGNGICVINATDDRQFSQEDKKWGGGHGVFTFFLLKALKGEADYNGDNIVTLGELIPFVSEKVRRATMSAQTPTVGGKFDPMLAIAR